MNPIKHYCKRSIKRGFYDAPVQSVNGKKRYSYLVSLIIGEEVKRRIFRTKRAAKKGAKTFANLLIIEGEQRPISIQITPIERREWDK